jgi:hypothetical protein
MGNLFVVKCGSLLNLEDIRDIYRSDNLVRIISTLPVMTTYCGIQCT